MTGSVLYALEGGVATITLNRPAVMNALDADMIRELSGACERGCEATDVRAILIRGEGPAFLAGGDVAMFQRNLPRTAERAGPLASEFHRGIAALRGARKPVLVAAHGVVAGAGISLLAAADLALAAASTRFMLAYANIGASPDGGATWSLPRLMGTRKAMELMLLSEPFDAKVALETGLVNRVVADESLCAEADAMARRLARGPTLAYAETKALVQHAFERPLDEQLDQEALAFARCARTGDFAEGVTAFVEKRQPRFVGG